MINDFIHILLQFEIPDAVELVAKPGDILGWYDEDAGALGYDFSNDGQVCLLTGVDKPQSGAQIKSMVTVNRYYAVQVTYSKLWCTGANAL